MSKNDITGDDLKTKPASKQYRANFDAIFKGEKLDAHFNGHGVTHSDNVNSELLETRALLASALMCLDKTERTSTIAGVRQNIINYFARVSPEFFDTLKLD